MDIIAHVTVDVKISTDKKPEENPDTLTTKVNQWADHKKLAANVARKIAALGPDKKGRAERMANCAQQIVYQHCRDCDTYSVKRTNLCRDRFCPVCNWRLSLQRYVNMTRMIEHIGDNEGRSYSLITLTVQNCAAENLSLTLKLMADTWNRILQRKVMKEKAIGWARSVEVTYQPKDNTLHPHYHVIVCWEGQAHHDSLIKAWLDSCAKDGLIANIKGQEAHSLYTRYDDTGDAMTHAILETFKYACKSRDLSDMPLGTFRQLVDALAGKRLVAFGGIFKQAAQDLRVNMEEVEQDEVSVCRRCGSVEVDRMIFDWCFTRQCYERIDRAWGRDL